MSKKNKYKIEYIMGVASRISTHTDVEGYSEGILEPFFPSDEELAKWTNAQHADWIKKNNKRMKAICDFLNKSNGL